LVTDNADVEGVAINVMKCDGGNNKLDLLTGENSDSVTYPPPIDS
jgi:hypothetical protein